MQIDKILALRCENMLANTNAVTVSRMSNSLMTLCQECLGCLCMLQGAEVMVDLNCITALSTCGISIIEQGASYKLILILKIQK